MITVPKSRPGPQRPQVNPQFLLMAAAYQQDQRELGKPVNVPETIPSGSKEQDQPR